MNALGVTRYIQLYLAKRIPYGERTACRQDGYVVLTQHGQPLSHRSSRQP